MASIADSPDGVQQRCVERRYEARNQSYTLPPDTLADPGGEYTGRGTEECLHYLDR